MLYFVHSLQFPLSTNPFSVSYVIRGCFTVIFIGVSIFYVFQFSLSALIWFSWFSRSLLECLSAAFTPVIIFYMRYLYFSSRYSFGGLFQMCFSICLKVSFKTKFFIDYLFNFLFTTFLSQYAYTFTDNCLYSADFVL